MSPKGRPEGEYRSAKHEGSPATPKGRPEGELAPKRAARRVVECVAAPVESPRQSTLPARANVAELLDSVLTLHAGRVQTLQVEVTRDFRGDLELFCFAGELRQLFANLIGNALDAMSPGGGRLAIRARQVRDGIRVSVGDTGTGITPEARRHIFEPFFTTKEATGTGLGLWVSEQIIRKHNGTVRLHSRPAQTPPDAARPCGTVFSVFFPYAGLEEQSAEQETQPEASESRV